MKTPTTRRDFLKIAFGTVSGAVLNNSALANLLPELAKHREIQPAYQLEIDESGYLYDAERTIELPSYREMGRQVLEVDDLPDQELLERIAQWCGVWEMEDFPLEVTDLDDPVDPGFACNYGSPYWLAENTEWGAGIELYRQLEPGVAQDLGLVFVEGEHPGSTFIAVRCDEPDGLQEGLLRHGINIELGAGYGPYD